MAISVKSMNGLAAIKKIGIKQSQYDWLESSNIKVQLTAKEFRFYVPSADGEYQAEAQHTVGVTLTTLQKLNAGTLPPAEKIALQSLMVSAVQTLKDAYAPQLELLSQKMSEGLVQLGEAMIPVAEAFGKAAKTLDALPPLAAADFAEVEQKVLAQTAWPEFDKSQLKTAQQVKLRDATMMYQPVFGTSGGSRYFLVAANADLRVAARYQGGSLSVRIEGPNWKKFTTNIASCGIDNISSDKDYASVHLQVGGDMVVASKTLGAVLLGLGIPLETPMPDLKVIKG